jgi:hypothetical protein
MTNPIAATRSPHISAARPPSTRHRAFSLVGAGIGVVVFLAIALLPSLVYGGVASVQLATELFGSSGAPTTGINVFIVLGMVITVTAAGSLFTAVGAVAGASLGALTRATPAAR